MTRPFANALDNTEWRSVRRRLLFCATVLLAWSTAVVADEVFDARGFTPNRDFFSQLPYEHIDPLTGNLLLTFTDLILPGNAGLGFRIQRNYNSKIYRDYQTLGDTLDEDSWAGVGWTLHLGRVLNPTGGRPGPIEMPDGSRHKLYLRNDGSGDFITREFWVYDRSAASPVLRLPNGVTYTFDRATSLPSGGTVRYVTQIRDPFGNHIDVQYMNLPVDGIQSITQDLGAGQVRTITFTAEGSGLRRLQTMTLRAGARVSTWTYEQVGTNAAGFNLLTRVRPPVGPPWEYAYNVSAPPRNELIGLTTPSGGQIAYAYADQTFNLGSTVPVRSRSVIQRRTSGRAVAPGTWNYAYAQGGGKNQSIIVSPCGVTTTYQFLGVGNHTTIGNVWKIGLVQSRSVSGVGGAETESFGWRASSPISSDTEIVGFNSDSAIFVPLTESRQVTRGGQTFSTSYSYGTANYNDFGRPNSIAESGDLVRVTGRTFQYGFTPYIVDRIASETVTVAGESFTKSYVHSLATGFKTSETIHLIPTSFGPDGRGNLRTVTDANNHTTTYAYDWGVVSSIQTPLFLVSRVINGDSTVSTETRRGFTTSFQYDSLMRLTLKTPPVGNAWVSTYDNVGGASVTTSRGPSFVVTSLDGMGRNAGTRNAAGVRMETSLDACGRRVYQSYPFTSLNIGTSFQYDALDRVRQTTNPDASRVAYTYEGIDVVITDEENRTTRQNWNAFGDPQEARLAAVTDGAGQATSYGYNALGNLTLVSSPDGVTRRWHYNPKNQLELETHPENGTANHTYDPAGNLKTRTDAQFGTTTYGYDANDRLTSVDRPGTVHDATFAYDHSDNRTNAANGYVSSGFAYDGANRLTSRHDVVHGQTFTTGLGYDNNDNLNRIDYPSGPRVTYTHDPANRIATVEKGAGGFYASSFTYHPSGSVESFRAGNDLVHSVTYDNRYRVDVLDAGSRLRLNYGHDRVGNVTSIADARGGMNQGFIYDNLDRVVTANGFWGGGGFSYDDLGNRRSKNIGGAGTNYAYDTASQRLTWSTGAEAESFAYDANGNILQNGGGTYTYTPENMLETASVGGSVTTYRYDADNSRKVKVAGVGTRLYIHGPGNVILSEFEAMCSGAGARPVRHYVYAGSRLLADLEQAVPSVSFEASASSGSEAAGVAQVRARVVTGGAATTGWPVCVSFATANGTATAGSDYSATSGTLVFPAGTPSGGVLPINVPIINDGAVDPNETFSVALSGPVGATLGPVTGHTVTIVDDDAPTVGFVAASGTVAEAAGPASLSVRMTTPAGGLLAATVTVAYASAGGSAVAGSDLTAVSGTLTFAAGTPSGSTQTILVPIVSDGLDEDDETFTVALSNPTGANLGTSPHTVTIVDDDSPPSLSVSDASVVEGSSGTVSMAFTISLSAPSGRTVSSRYATVDRSADAGSDYVASSGTVSFTAGSQSQVISVPVIGDTLDESNEAFVLALSEPMNVALGRGLAQGTILDDDGSPATCQPIALLPAAITHPGSFCLAQDLAFTASAGNAISIEADDVVLDLAGFRLTGRAAGSGTQATGIWGRNRKNLTVRRGTVHGFYRGIVLKDSTDDYSASSGHLVEEVNIVANWGVGIFVEGRGTVVRTNLVVDTGGTTVLGTDADVYGIRIAGPGSRLLDNDVRDTVGVGTGAAFTVHLARADGVVVDRNRLRGSAVRDSYGVKLLSTSNALLIGNRLSTLSVGIHFDASNGKYRDNLAVGVSSPYAGGTDAGNNQ